jgi:hypothetical protein
MFFGGYASSLYTKYMKSDQRHLIQNIPDFDVLSDEPDKCALIIQERLEDNSIKNVKTVIHESIDDIIPKHYEIIVGKETVAMIYEPIACYNYNTIRIGNLEINVATIDTMLSFYLAFLYANLSYYNKERILCMANFLFDVEQKNRLEQKGLLKRFTTTCYGKQKQLEDMRSEKTEMFKKLSSNKKSKEYEMWFLKYNPAQYISRKVETTDEDGATSSIIVKPIKDEEIVNPKKARRKRAKKTQNTGFLF